LTGKIISAILDQGFEVSGLQMVKRNFTNKIQILCKSCKIFTAVSDKM
jgi:hypothetical protein